MAAEPLQRASQALQKRGYMLREVDKLSDWGRPNTPRRLIFMTAKPLQRAATKALHKKGYTLKELSRPMIS